MRVVIAEDEPVYRKGLRELLSAAGIEVIHETASGEGLLEYLAHGEPPDVVILDIRMAANDDGLLAADVMGRDYPEVGVLVLSSHSNDTIIRRFFEPGTRGRGYLLKEQFSNVDDVRTALDLIRRGKSYSDTTVLDALRRQEPTIEELLSPREAEVLALLASGRSNNGIAEQLKITATAVDNAIQSLYTKLDIPRGTGETPRVHAALRWWFGTQPPSRS